MSTERPKETELGTPWFEVSYFNELGDGIASSSIGELSTSLCYMREVFAKLEVSEDGKHDTPELWSTFMRRDLEEFLVKWVEGFAFERNRRDLFKLEDGIDPFVNAFMDFLKSGVVEREYFGLSTVVTWESDPQMIDGWVSQGFGADLTWRFRRDPELQIDDLHRIWHLLHDKYPKLPVSI